MKYYIELADNQLLNLNYKLWEESIPNKEYLVERNQILMNAFTAFVAFQSKNVFIYKHLSLC